MADYRHPGVYVQELPSAVQPIQGVSTSTAAFIGVTNKGPIPGTILPNGRMARPVLVTSFTDYQRQFGGFRQDSFLTYAVQSFFQNGGQQLVCGSGRCHQRCEPANHAAERASSASDQSCDLSDAGLCDQ